MKNFTQKFVTAGLVILNFTGLAQAAKANLKPTVVVALAKVKPGQEGIFKDAVLEILAPTRKEKGAIQFVFNQSLSSPTEFAFYEQWKNQEDLDAHLKSAHMQSFFLKVGNAFEPGFPSIKTYRQVEK